MLMGATMIDSNFFQVTLGGLIGSSIATAFLGALLLRWSKRVEAEVKSHFDERRRIFESRRAWNEQVVCELLGPLCIHFARSKSAFDRWKGKNLFLEAQIVRKVNEAIRDTLLTKGHLIPPHLVSHATALIEHYDVWMEHFDRIRCDANPDSGASFIFVGPAGFPFPRDAESEFKDEFQRLRKELYGE